MTRVAGITRAAPRAATIARFAGVLALGVMACSDPSGPIPPREENWSFEAGMEAWTAAAADIHVGGTPIDWWARLSTARASHGSRSVEIYMDNRTDAAKVWIVRPFAVEPNRDYVVHLNFDFASRDYGDVNLFQLLAGASPTAPVTGAEVLAVARTNMSTGNGAGSDVGFQWSHRYMTKGVRSSPNGSLYILVGVWGTWETPRTYYVDNVSVELTPL